MLFLFISEQGIYVPIRNLEMFILRKDNSLLKIRQNVDKSTRRTMSKFLARHLELHERITQEYTVEARDLYAVT